jgi:ABC-type amino acid transport substrate-binding protein
MKKHIKLLALLLVFAALLPLSACSNDGELPYRIIETVGKANYTTAYRQGDKVAAQAEAAMSVLAADGTLSRLSQEWLGQDISCRAGDKDALAKLSLPPEPRTLIVGVDEAFYPLSYTDGDGYIGMNVDIAQALGALTGWTIRIQPISPADLAAQLGSGNIDCALGFDVSQLDTSKFTVGECYMQSDIVLAAASDSDVKRVKDLKGLKIGAVKGTSAIPVLAANDKVVKYADSITAYLSPVRCINALKNGWCAAIAMDSIMLRSYFLNYTA